MIRTFCAFLLLSGSLIQAQDDTLRKELDSTYALWRHSIQTRNDMNWRKVTAHHRQMAVKNRLLSEKKKFPQGVFDLPAVPPSLNGLKYLGSKRRGPTAKSYYFGKIDFGLGGNPAENLLVLSYVGAAKSWRFDQVEYINLAVLPDIRKQLSEGNIEYIDKTPELLPTGDVPPTPAEVREAQYIAKIYVYCPGREVRAQVNRISLHEFENAQQAQLVIGGARKGVNQIQFAIKDLVAEGVKEAMTVRVYLMSEVNGVKPIKAYEYQVDAETKPKGFIEGTFNIDAKVHRALMGR